MIRICPQVKHTQYCWMHLIWFHKIALFVQFSLLVSYFLCNLHDNKVCTIQVYSEWLTKIPDKTWQYKVVAWLKLILHYWWMMRPGPWCQDGALFQCQLFNAFLNKLQTNFFPSKSWVFVVCTFGKSQRLLSGTPKNHSVM